MHRSALVVPILAIAAVLLATALLTPAAPAAQPTATEEYVFPTIPPFQVPGDIQTPGAQQTASAVATVPAAPGTIRVVGPEGGGEDERVPLGRDVAVELILDNSGSMLQPLGDELRIDVAKRVLTDLVEETLPPEVPLALRVFGDEPDSCETSLAVPLQPLDPETVVEEIARLQSVNLVKTPLGAALELVAEDLADVEGPKIIVLVTDGEETCGGDPAAAIETLRAGGIDVHVNIVGFAVDDEALKETFRAWVALGGGAYFDATGADDLDEAIVAAVQPPFRVLAAAGEPVASGVVNGAPVPVPAGTYTVEVDAEPPQPFAEVEVGDGENVELTLDDEE